MGRRKGRPYVTRGDDTRMTLTVPTETYKRIRDLSDRTGHSIIEIADRLINAALDGEETPS